jgi:UDP-glucose 4-epimerase
MPDWPRHAVVAGGTGFIGSYVVQALLAEGWRVTVVGRNGVPINRQRYTSDQLNCVIGDLVDTALHMDAAAKADVYIHLVHSTVPGDSMRNVGQEIQDTVVPTVRLLSQLSSPTLKRFIYVSSGGTVYGHGGAVPIAEDHPTEPISAYGVAKLALEKYVALYGKMHGFPTAIVRPSNAYGLGQKLDRMQGAVGIFMNRLLQDQPIHIWGDGSTVRDYVHVADLARAMALVAADSSVGVWNVGTGVGTDLRGLIALLEKATGRQARVTFGPARSYDVAQNILDVSRLRRSLRWEPRITLEQGINQLYAAAENSPVVNALPWRHRAPNGVPEGRSSLYVV